jgi:hypothetical protein
MAFFAVALTASPPTRLFLMILGMALMAFTISRLAPRLRTSPSVAQVLSNRTRPGRSAETVAVGACVRTVDEQNRSTPEDAIDLVRMDDDGGWQVARPPIEGPRAHAPVETHRASRDASDHTVDRRCREIAGIGTAEPTGFSVLPTLGVNS